MSTPEQASVTQAFSAMHVVQQEPAPKDEPTFLYGSCAEYLKQSSALAIISMVSHSPLLEPAGARQLIDYLASLPHPSVVLLGDSLNRHNIVGMSRGHKRNGISEEKAWRLALTCGDMYAEAISKAIQENKDVAGSNKITILRWQDTSNEQKSRQEAIMLTYYKKDKRFREQIDDLALGFIYHRLPQCKHASRRLPYMVNYLLDEIPLFVTGVKYNGQHYSTLMYPTSIETLAREKNCPRGKSVWSIVDDIHNDPALVELKEELLLAADGTESRNGVAILPIFRQSEEKQLVNAEGCQVADLVSTNLTA